MTRFKIKSFYSFTALAAIVPLIAMLLITLFYIDRQETKHQENLMGNAQADIVSSLEDTLEDLQRDAASLTTSMDYLVFCNSSTSRRVHNAGNSVLNTLKNALQAYPKLSVFSFIIPSRRKPFPILPIQPLRFTRKGFLKS